MGNADRGKVVIAGGSGFLGLSLATHLASTGWSVVIFYFPDLEQALHNLLCEAA